MSAYILRRLFLLIPTFIGITFMVFIITRFVPGGPIERIIAEARFSQIDNGGGVPLHKKNSSSQPLSEKQIEFLKIYYELDKPVWESYINWFQKILKGDLGKSIRYHDPVWSIIRERIPISLYFGTLSLIMIYGISIPLGIAKAIHYKSFFDDFSSILIFIGYAIPGWIVGVLLLVLLASKFDLFPLGGIVSDFYSEMNLFHKIWDIAHHTVLPLLAYVMGSFTIMTLLMKNTLMDNLSSDYVRTAMAKGLSFKQAVFSHALRNSLIPIATNFGNTISVIIMGSFLIEKVFNIDGMGLLGYESVMDRDYPVVMGILVISSLLFMVGNILSDICVALVDPRVRFK